MSDPTMSWCPLGGSVVDAKMTVPEDISTAAPDAFASYVGCNRLRCSRCGAWVRQQANAVYKGKAEPEDAARVYARKNMRDDPSVVDGSNLIRLYVCVCSVHNATRQVFVEPEPDDDFMSNPTTLPPWRCHGHPKPQSESQ